MSARKATGAMFGSRYGTFGFSDEAGLDEGVMPAASFALKGLTYAERARIAALVTSGERSDREFRR